jgi:hypothetical protein
MIRVNNLTDSANQRAAVVLADGTVATLTFIYRGAIQRWAVDVSYGAFAENGINLCVHPNLLRMYRNFLPIGLAVISRDGGDPFDINDFASGRISVFVLDGTPGGSDEVEGVETNVYAALV